MADAAPAMEMVPCPPMSARVTLSACGRMFRAAQERRPDAWQSISHCRTCALGAGRAGQSLALIHAAAAVEAIRLVCAGCDQPAARLIHGRHCVSCYNRRLEAKRGRNGKGGRPRILDQLHAEAVVVAPTGETSRTVVLGSVLSRTEAIVILAREAGRPVAFGVPPLRRPVGYQTEMFF